MKKYITTIILVVLFVSLLGFFYFFESDKEDKTEEEPIAETFVVWELNSDEIVAIELEHSKKDIKLVKKEDGNWKLKDIKIDEDKINSLMDSLQYIEAMGEEITYENLSDFGLEKPDARVKIKLSDGSEKELIFGSLSLGGTEVYVKASDKDYVFLTDKILLDNLKIKEEDLKEKEK